MRLTLPLLAALSIASPVLAEEEQGRCAPFDQVEAMLGQTYHETRVQQSLGDEGKYMLVIFASPNGETWTAAMVRSDGMACLAAAGTDWQHREDKAPVPETPL